MEKTITFTLNGQPKTVTTDPSRPLLEVLREDLEMTGAKYGCGEGRCGACTVLVDGQSTLACITAVGKVGQQTVLTIEGLAPAEGLHPVQTAFLEEGAAQCGYCTPGMILETVSFLKSQARPTEDQIRSRMEGHLCRCGNYPKIIKAIQRAAGAGK